MKKTYILKKPLPWAKEGTELELKLTTHTSDVVMEGRDVNGIRRIQHFPVDAFSEWLEEKNAERWRPKTHEVVWFVDHTLKVYSLEFHESDLWHEQLHRIGNMFDTKEQAEEAAKRVRATLGAYHEEIGE